MPLAPHIGYSQAAHFSDSQVLAGQLHGGDRLDLRRGHGLLDLGDDRIDLSLCSRIAAGQLGIGLPERDQSRCLGGIDGIAGPLQLNSADQERFSQRQRLS